VDVQAIARSISQREQLGGESKSQRVEEWKRIEYRLLPAACRLPISSETSPRRSGSIPCRHTACCGVENEISIGGAAMTQAGSWKLCTAAAMLAALAIGRPAIADDEKKESDKPAA